MKQKLLYSFKMRAVMLVAILCAGFTSAWGQAAVNTILWEETWFDGTANATPSSYQFSGTTVYGDATLTYAQSSTNTKLYDEALAGGTKPELLLSKSNQTWTISNIPTGQASEMSLSFLSNRTTFEVTSSTTGITISGSGKSWTISATSNVSTFNLTIKNTGSSNARIDDIKLIVTKAGSSSNAVATTTTIDDSGITNTDVYTSTVAGSLAATVTAGGNAVAGATVTWSGNNDNVATINSSTGAVTLVGAGSVTFTATYAGVTDTYQPSSATYEMTVTSSAPYVQPTGFEIALNNTLFGTTYNGSASGITDNSPISGSQDNVTVTYAGGGNHYVNDSQIRVYPSNKLTFEAPDGYNLTKIVITASSTGCTLKVGDTTIDTSNKTWEGEAASVVFEASGSSGNWQITKATITLAAESTDPSITADNVNIAYDATGGSFDYTINNPVEGGVVSVDWVSDDDWLTSATENNGTVSFTCTANATNAERQALVEITYTYNTNETVTKDVWITQAAAPVIYSNIPTLFAAATSTETDVRVTFGGWVVSAVHNNNAYLTDNQGNGLIIYSNEHGFQVNDVLTGTVSCKLQLYRGSAELTNLTASTEGLTVTSGGTVTAQTIAISNLGGVNTGALLSFEGLTYNGTALVDGNSNAITPWNTLFSGTFEDGKSYDVTGIYVQYNDTKELLPRSADDIEEGQAPITPNSNATLTFDFSTNDFNFPEGSDNKTVDATDYTDDTYTINVAGSSGNGYYWNSAGYLLMGKSGATLTLPAFPFNVSKISVTGTSSASPSVSQNIYVDNDAVSTATTGAQGKHEYEIAAVNQAAGTIYTLKVTSAHNTQISKIEVYGYEPVSVTDAGFATYCSANALDFTGTGIEAYVGTLSGTTLTFTPISQVPANTGLLLVRDGGDTKNIPVIASATAVDNNCLVGVNEPATLTANDYILNVVNGAAGFYKAGEFTSLAAHRAYIPAQVGGQVKSFAINLDDTDAIGAIKAVNDKAEIFNLAGQRVNKVQKGIYIVNGKKVLVK